TTVPKRSAARCHGFARALRPDRSESHPERSTTQDADRIAGDRGSDPLASSFPSCNDQGEAMTTLDNRPNTALLVIDVQNGVVGGAYERDTVVANVGNVVDKARAEEVPVVWVQHASDNLAEGSEQWQIVPELSPDDSEPHVDKRYPD